MTSTERILRYMQDYGSITPVEAYTECGCMRLASRISDLRVAGHKIKKEMVKDKNRYGETVSYAKYSLEGEAK